MVVDSSVPLFLLPLVLVVLVLFYLLLDLPWFMVGFESYSPCEVGSSVLECSPKAIWGVGFQILSSIPLEQLPSLIAHQRWCVDWLR